VFNELAIRHQESQGSAAAAVQERLHGLRARGLVGHRNYLNEEPFCVHQPKAVKNEKEITPAGVAR